MPRGTGVGRGGSICPPEAKPVPCKAMNSPSAYRRASPWTAKQSNSLPGSSCTRRPAMPGSSAGRRAVRRDLGLAAYSGSVGAPRSFCWSSSSSGRMARMCSSRPTSRQRIRSALCCAFPDQLGHRVPLRGELPSGAKQTARQLAPIRDDTDQDLLCAFHRLPVEAVSRLDAQPPPDLRRDSDPVLAGNSGNHGNITFHSAAQFKENLAPSLVCRRVLRRTARSRGRR
jgi:hypothetical protein